MTPDKKDDQPNPYQSPEAVDAPAAVVERRHLADKRRVMGWMLALYGLAACVDYFVPQDRGTERLINLITGIVFGALCVRWCHYDRLDWGGRPWRFFVPMMVICPGPLLIFPAHFWTTRGFGRGSVATFYALGFFIVLLAAYALVSLILTTLLG